jgi:hypothetical protein
MMWYDMGYDKLARSHKTSWLRSEAMGDWKRLIYSSDRRELRHTFSALPPWHIPRGYLTGYG